MKKWQVGESPTEAVRGVPAGWELKNRYDYMIFDELGVFEFFVTEADAERAAKCIAAVYPLFVARIRRGK